jgi:glycosyltransferase involved in cell wall biosynthesis
LCVVTYNDRDELLDTLESLEAQLPKLLDLSESGQIELIISDNCSTDDTQEIVSRFRNTALPVVRSFLQNENLGFRGNLEFCAKASSGEWILYLGAGDLPNLESIEAFVTSGWHPDCNLVYFNSQSLDVKTGITHQSGYQNDDKPPYSQAPFPIYRRQELLTVMSDVPNLTGDYWPQVEWAIPMSRQSSSQIGMLTKELISSKRPERGWWSLPDAFLVPLHMNLVLAHYLKNPSWNKFELESRIQNNPALPAVWIYQSRVPHRSRRPKLSDLARLPRLFPNLLLGLIATAMAMSVWLMPRSILAVFGRIARGLK